MPFVPMTGLQLPDDGATIWRYMDFWKFESILDTFGLYFVRSDQFSDSWDSVLPPNWQAKMRREMCDRAEGGTYTEADWYEKREIPSNPIYCWNCDANENERMWHEYTNGTDALVIQSTVGSLKQCFSATKTDVRIGRVNYGYHDDLDDLDDLDDPKFAVAYWGDNAPPKRLSPWYVPRYLKRVEFAFEKEIRASMHVARDDQPIDRGYNLVIGAHGVQTLIKSIRVHPRAPTGFSARVVSLLFTYELGGIKVEHSSL